MKTQSIIGVVFLAAFATACAKAPDSDGVEEAIRSTVLAQGGVCVGQDFAWMVGERDSGTARVVALDDGESSDGDDYRVAVQSRRASKFQWGDYSGDSRYDDNVLITDLAVRSADDCTFTPR